MLNEVKTEKKTGIINLGLKVRGELTNKPGFWVVNTEFVFNEILEAFTKAISNLTAEKRPSSVKNIRTFNGFCSFPLSNNLQKNIDKSRIGDYQFSLALVPRTEDNPKDMKICLVGYLPNNDSESFVI